MWWWTCLRTFSGLYHQVPLFRHCGENKQQRLMCLWMMNQYAQLSLPQHLHSSFLHHRECFHSSKIHIVVSFLGLLVYLCFSRKHGAEYASGVSRPCYSCNIRYMQWIYSMCTVFPYPWTWLYTCVGMHMLNLPRGVFNVAQKMCDTQYIFSCCHFYKVWKNKSFGGYGLGDVRGWYDWLVRSRTVFYWDGQSFLLD